MIRELVADLYSDAPYNALTALCAETRRIAARQELEACLPDRAILLSLLASSEPKTRKNAARLIGALAHPEDAKPLAAALTRETTLYIVPSLLLSLGSCGGEEAKKTLTAYVAPKPKDETEQKHCAEIAEALRKACAQVLPHARAKTPLTSLASPASLLLSAPAGMADVLAEELRELDFSPIVREDDAVTVVTGALDRLFLARCFTELLMPVGTSLPLDPARLADAVRSRLTAPYRVELRGYRGDRAAFIAAFVQHAKGENDPYGYDIEVRIQCVEAGKCDLYIKPMNVPDHRFTYRKRVLPASIHPATAAAIMRYAAPYVKAEEPRVLDPFCGSGTMLFEREVLSPCAGLLGVDRAENAVSCARENGMNAKSSARFVQKDILKFRPRSPFDEIVANMPFGNRVGTHEDNKPLYAGFVRMLPELLADGGVAVLYTMERRLLFSCLKREPRLLLQNEKRTEAGGLLPWVFIVGKK